MLWGALGVCKVRHRDCVNIHVRLCVCVCTSAMDLRVCMLFSEKMVERFINVWEREKWVYAIESLDKHICVWVVYSKTIAWYGIFKAFKELRRRIASRTCCWWYNWEVDETPRASTTMMMQTLYDRCKLHSSELCVRCNYGHRNLIA